MYVLNYEIFFKDIYRFSTWFKKKINKSEFYDEVVILGALQHVFFKKKKNILKLCKIS